METILRAVVVYLALLLIFRISGKRSLASVTTFDFVLVLIIAEATQQALLGQDYSVTQALLVIVTLVAIDIGLSVLAGHVPGLEKILDSTPLVLVREGKPSRENMRKERVQEEDIMSAARELQGLENAEQIRCAVLERSGAITVVPK